MSKPHLFQQLGDLELLALVKNDNTLAFDELYRRYWAILVNAAYKRLGSRAVAEDLVQDLFVTIYQRRYSIDISTNFGAYLNQALKFSILNQVRSMLVRDRYIKESFFMGTCKNDLVSELDGKELKTKISASLEALPPKCREVFLLSRRDDQPHKDISAHLNISVSTVEKHIVKALKVLRSDLIE
ncbi:MAG: RNA polymerase sigma-70 factor [Chitinophagaceae bacterium]|nr:MAG: RNA polymerase sigma-70 factor [Chitinophagaceae bacterium]